MPVKLSVVIPCYNEKETLNILYEHLSSLFSGAGLDYEIILVDDGSHDSTLEIIKQLSSKDNRIRFISLSRNFGQQTAIMAGLDAATKDAVVIMDADLQDPPEIILDMIKKWQEGFQVVYAVREKREGETIFKKVSAKLFYRLIRSLSGMDMPADAGDFRLIDKKIVADLKTMRAKNPYIRGMISWVGYKQIGITYKRQKRLAGTTKYSLAKMIRFALDGIVLFSLTPLRLASYLGFSVAALCVIYIFYSIYMRVYLHATLPGWTSLMVAVLFLGSVQLISLGIIGEYLGRIHDQTSPRPLYLVKEKSE
jgi:polyisoprenyl-phosphate glycosyltransferase